MVHSVNTVCVEPCNHKLYIFILCKNQKVIFFLHEIYLARVLLCNSVYLLFTESKSQTKCTSHTSFISYSNILVVAKFVISVLSNFLNQISGQVGVFFLIYLAATCAKTCVFHSNGIQSEPNWTRITRIWELIIECWLSSPCFHKHMSVYANRNQCRLQFTPLVLTLYCRSAAPWAFFHVCQTPFVLISPL